MEDRLSTVHFKGLTLLSVVIITIISFICFQVMSLHIVYVCVISITVYITVYGAGNHGGTASFVFKVQNNRTLEKGLLGSKPSNSGPKTYAQPTEGGHDHTHVARNMKNLKAGKT